MPFNYPIFKYALTPLLRLSLVAMSVSALPSFGENTNSHSPRLEQESVYQVLVGDFAAYRGQYDTALSHYLSQAKKLKSADLAKQATHVALHEKQFLDMLDASLMWRKYSEDAPKSVFFNALAYAYTQKYNQALEAMRTVLNQGEPTDFTRLVNLLPKDHPSVGFYRLELRQANIKHKKNYDLALAQSLIYKRLNDPEPAIKYAEQAMRLFPQDKLPLLVYSVKILQFYKRDDLIQKNYLRLLSEQPDNIKLRQQYIQYLSQSGESAEKKLSNKAAIQQQLEILIQQYPEKQELHYHLGLILLDQEKLDEAATHFEKSLQGSENENTSSQHYYLGLIYQHKQQYKKALEHFEAITQTEEKLRIAAQQAKAYARTQQPEKALTTINKALEQAQPLEQSQQLLITKANIYQQQKQLPEALAILNQAITASPDAVELRYQRAMLHESMGNHLAMEQDFRHLIAKYPNDALAFNALGYTLADRNERLEEALDLIEKAYQLNPEDPAILDSLGWVMYRLGRTDEALNFLSQAFDTISDDEKAEIAAHLGEVLWVSGQQDNAKTIFYQAINHNPSHKILTETMQRLDVPAQ